MSASPRAWPAWLLPPLIGGAMAAGSIVGLSFISDAAGREGPSGDAAGAAGALMIVICFATGFVLSTLTIVAAKLLRRDAPGHIVVRLILSLAVGGAVGSVGMNSGTLATSAAWVLLLAGPVLLSWSGANPRG